MLNLFLKAYYNKPITTQHNQNILIKIDTRRPTKSVNKTKQLNKGMIFTSVCISLRRGYSGRWDASYWPLQLWRGARYKELKKVIVWITRYREVGFSRGSAVFLSLHRKRR